MAYKFTYLCNKYNADTVEEQIHVSHWMTHSQTKKDEHPKLFVFSYQRTNGKSNFCNGCGVQFNGFALQKGFTVRTIRTFPV